MTPFEHLIAMRNMLKNLDLAPNHRHIIELCCGTSIIQLGNELNNLKVENNRLRAFSDEKVRENAQFEQELDNCIESHSQLELSNAEKLNQIIKLTKAIEEVRYFLERGDYNTHTLDNILKKALAGKEDGRNLGSPKEPKKPESDRKEGK